MDRFKDGLVLVLQMAIVSKGPSMTEHRLTFVVDELDYLVSVVEGGFWGGDVEPVASI